MKIDITFIDLRHQKVVKQYDGYIELLPDRIHYKHEFKAEEPKGKDDLAIGWEKVMNCFERSVHKHSIVCLDLEFVQGTEENKNGFNYWNVNLSVNGAQKDISIFFSEETEARKVYSEVYKWLFDAG